MKIPYRTVDGPYKKLKIMVKKELLSIVTGISAVILTLLCGCTSVNNHNILLSEPYSKVRYISNPDARGYVTVDVVQQTGKGKQANIIDTIPRLYLKAQERVNRQDVILGNIQITSFTRTEQHEVPYRKCWYVPVEVKSPKASCSSSSCRPEQKSRVIYKKMCRTELRTETREVLCQKVTADILSKQEKE